MNFEDFGLYEKFLDDTASPTGPASSGDIDEFTSYITAANQESGSETTAYRGIKFEFGGMRFNTSSHKIPRADVITQTFGFVAESANVYYYDATATDTY